MEKKKCCECAKETTEKLLIDKKEWNKLFRKEDNVLCKISSKDCCCHYTVIHGIKSSDIDETLMSKIFHVAGPISVLNKIVQDAFLYFLNWTVDEKALRGAITELSNVIKDETFRNDILQQISSCNLSQLDENSKTNDASGWVSKKLRNQKATPETPLRIHVFDKDGLIVKSVQVPKDFSSPNRKGRIVELGFKVDDLHFEKKDRGGRKTDYVEQLDVIDDIRREIVLSSSGVLSTSRFQEILQLIRKVIEKRLSLKLRKD
ncbi:unnamed protein product [Mytilus edulis]|uniref:Uncharacterized protein n=1 Tax=Mytilus edulis TaxID=6550 RepID=A0A8S3RRY7_MYTED|nr:unnamed protein product [Mytilus edulis]